ncbi:aldehyde dehydrogenase family protein [Candidatus Pelagibacter ubique]|uniref:aldehyde dehydrogenase family protein n=1 Tax=Pelagibacter ubique TaxID=198252 RepID=UPI0003C80033
MSDDFKKNIDLALGNAKRLSNKILIDGKLISAKSSNKIKVVNPSTGEQIGEAPQCDKIDVDVAVNSAETTFHQWKKIPARERGKMMTAAARKLEERKDEIETLLALDTGNALRTQAKPETTASIELTHMFAGLAGEIKGENYPPNIPNTIHYTTKDPIGVVCAIIPWNAPLFLTVAKIAPAIVAGNTVVLKTAEQAPFCALLVCEILQQELPPGVLNVISGYGEECGEPLITHEKVRKVTFTGSFSVGKIIALKAAPKLCPVTLELGGKNPNIIMSDADLELAIPGVIDGMRYTRQGQACTAGSRVYIHEKIYDKVLEGAVDKLSKLKMGNALDETSDIGAIISEEQLNRTLYYMDIAKKNISTEILHGGNQSKGGEYKDGFYYEPTLLSGLPVSSPVCQEEVFGPVACAIPFKSFDEAMKSANDTPFGLSAVLWTKDLSRALQFVDEIEAGFVQVNQCVAPRANVSYGGIKMSGLGKEYAFDSMMNHFTQSKTVLINRGKSNIDN